MASPAVDYARGNQQRFLNELKDLLRIPSISTLQEHKADVRKAAEFVANDFRRIGLEHVEIIPTKGHPLVYADWLNAPGKPTVLCYAHYDVQPPDPLDEWTTPPFETDRARQQYLCPRRGRRQRPALDGDEGHRVSDEGAQRQAAAQCEIHDRGRGRSRWRVHRRLTCAKQKPSSKPTSLWSAIPSCSRPDLPTLCVGLRGLVYTEIEAVGAKTDLHSGMYGGAAPNPFFGADRNHQ